MPRIYRWQQIITYTVTMLDAGDRDPESGEILTAEGQDESAKEWMEQARPHEFYNEDWVYVDDHDPEFIGMTAPMVEDK